MPKFIIAKVARPDLLQDSGPVADRENKRFWGGLTFSPSPIVHDTLKKAEAERDKLASLCPGNAFIIFQALSAAHTATPPLAIVSMK